MIGKRLLKKLFLNTNTCMYIAMVSAILLFVTLGVFKINQSELFYSYDPFYHYHITLYNELDNPFASGVSGLDGQKLLFDYPTLFRPLTAIYATVTSVDLITIYKYSGVFLRIITGFLMFVLIKKITQDKLISVLGFFLVLFTPYLFYRSLISFPENMVLIFHLLTYISIISSLKKKEINYGAFVFLGISLLIHYRSAVVPFFAVGIWLFYEAYRYYKRKRIHDFVKKITMGGLILLVISSPVIVNIFQQYTRYTYENIGASAELRTIFENTTQYTIPSFELYETQLGYFIVVMFFILLPLSIKYIYRKENFNIYIFFFLLSIFTFLLTRGPQIGLYIPPIRMLSYFSLSIIPLFLIMFHSIQEIIGNRVKIIFVLCCMLVFTVYATDTKGWVGLKSEDIRLGYYLNNTLDDNSVIVWDKFNPIYIGISHYDIIEPDWKKNQNLLDDSNLDVLKSRLDDLYKNKTVIIITGKKLDDYLLVTKTDQINVYRYPVNEGN